MTKVTATIDGKEWEMVAVGYGEWSDELDNYTLYSRDYFEDMPGSVSALVAAGVDMNEISSIAQRPL